MTKKGRRGGSPSHRPTRKKGAPVDQQLHGKAGPWTLGKGREVVRPVTTPLKKREKEKKTPTP